MGNRGFQAGRIWRFAQPAPEPAQDGKVWTNLEKLFQQDGKPFVEEEF